jgi:signal transduction histidine kinase
VIHPASIVDRRSRPYGALVEMARPTAVPRWPHPFALIPIAIVQVVGTIGATHGQPEARPMDALAVLLLLAGPLALYLLRTRPVVSLWAVIAITLVFIGRGYALGPVIISPTIALIRAVLTGHRRAAWLAGVVGVAGAMVAHVVSGHPHRVNWGSLFGVVAWVAIVLAGAEVIRNRAERRASLAAARAEQARRQASEERLRIAQELHDVLAHNISLINVQAGVGLHLMDAQPEQARQALTSIRQASKEALGELRSVLDLLRGNESGAPRAPTGSLDQLEALLARVRTPELDVVLERSGDVRPVPPGVDLAAYRIVQEALTNVVRHATAARRALVRLEYRERALVVQVDDDGRAPGAIDAEADGGNGLPGMRERASALGGSFTAGARPGGGFRVRAELPIEPAATPAAVVEASP